MMLPRSWDGRASPRFPDPRAQPGSTVRGAMSIDTIYALASGRPPAAIAIVRLSGPAAHEAGRRVAGELPPARAAALRRFKDPATGLLVDEGLLLRFDGPQ